MGFFVTKNVKVSSMGDPHTEKTLHVGRVILVVFVLIVLISLACSCFTVVGVGHTGVRSTFGRVSEDVLQEGLHFKSPVDHITFVDNRIVKLEVETEAFSSDLQTVQVRLATNYRVDPSMSYYIVKNVGTNYEDILVTPAVDETMKAIESQYTAEQSVKSRNEISAALLEQLSEKLAASGISVVDINIIDFDFSEEYISAIEAKQVAEQEKLRAQTEQEKLTMEKEAEAERKVIDAQAAADVAKIEAEAAEYAGKREAAANEAIAASLTGELIAYYQIQQWNGQLPTVTGSDTIYGFGSIGDNSTTP